MQNTKFCEKMAKEGVTRILASGIVGDGKGGPVGNLALKFGVDVDHTGRITPKLLDVTTDISHLVPERERPRFLTEGAVQDCIWNSDKAMSWLAEGRRAQVWLEPAFKKGSVRADFVIDCGEKLRIVELEKDGKNLARKDLEKQHAGMQFEGILDPETPIDLVALDARSTKWKGFDVPPGCTPVSLTWRSAVRHDDPESMWIILYPQGDPAWANPSWKPEDLGKSVRVTPAWSPCLVHVQEEIALLPSGRQRCAAVRLVIPGDERAKDVPGALVTVGARNVLNAWLSALVAAVQKEFRSDGAHYSEHRQVQHMFAEGRVLFPGMNATDVLAIDGFADRLSGRLNDVLKKDKLFEHVRRVGKPPT